MKVEFEFVGPIIIKSLRDFIIERHLSQKDALLLNSKNYDDIILEFRETYKENIKKPYLIFDTPILEDVENRVPLDRIGLTSNELEIKSERRILEELDRNETVYRCGWCGNIVDEDGEQLSTEVFNHKSKILRKFQAEAFVQKVTGYCCRNQN